MNADRELLTFAAKVAGYWDNEFNCPANLPDANWDPGEDDGQTLRLAVRLGFEIRQVHFAAHAGHPGIFWQTVHYHQTGGSAIAATRLAVLRAAAHTGKAMP